MLNNQLFIKRVLLLNLSIVVLSISSMQAQVLLNGDLEAPNAGISNVAPGWNYIPAGHPYCSASSGGTTPDLISISLPNSSSGMAGNPFSGNLFAGGSHGVSASTGTSFHEGIKQMVTGLVPGQNYRVSFRQSVLKVSHNIDTSGSWMVLLDTGLVAVTPPSINTNPYLTDVLVWDQVSVQFTATQNSHEIMFLPFDDDANHMSSPTNEGGSLYMAIDSINIVAAGFTSVQQHDPLPRWVVFPNPASRFIKVTGLSGTPPDLAMYDGLGRCVLFIDGYIGQELDLSRFTMGIYSLTVTSGTITETLRVMIKPD
jgi:hypothetical protein